MLIEVARALTCLPSGSGPLAELHRLVMVVLPHASLWRLAVV
jgi:hypothetical protein